MESLQLLDVSQNLFTGSLPSTLTRLRELNRFFVQKNKFGSTLEIFEDESFAAHVTNADFSSNQFVGSLPMALFNSTALLSVASVDNCLSTYLSADLCLASNLEVLVLDGIGTALTCRNSIFGGAYKRAKSYMARHTLSKQKLFPLCLLRMPSMNTLHLSGLGVHGSFPEVVKIGPKMRYLSLSHNFISGPIPQSIQVHAWQRLDLSFNKMSGTLSPDLSVPSKSLSLNINRLSGYVPQSMLISSNVSSLTVLDGNIFQCDTSIHVLPPKDPKAGVYDCGSHSFDFPAYLFASIMASVISASLVLLLVKRSIVSPVRNIMSELMSIIGHDNAELRESGHVKHILTFEKAMRVWIYLNCLCILILVVILIPANASLSRYFGSYEFKYSWTVSLAFLSGREPALILLIIYLFIAIIMIFFAS